MVETERYKGVKEMTSTWFDQGLERGLEQGLEQGLERGQRRLLRRLLENRFGPLGPHADDRLKSWPVDRLEELGLALLQAQSLRELGLED
jgi:hypothetical protein